MAPALALKNVMSLDLDLRSVSLERLILKFRALFIIKRTHQNSFQIFSLGLLYNMWIHKNVLLVLTLK